MGAHRFSVCEPVLRGDTFDDDLRIAVEAGLTTMGVFAIRLGDVEPAKAAVQLRDAGMAVSNYSYFGRVVDTVDQPGAADEGRTMIEDAAAVGAPALVVVSGPQGDRPLGDAEKIVRDWFAEMAPFAAERGVKLVLEALHPIKRTLSFVHTLSHAVDITAGIDNAFVLADTGHLWWDRNLVSEFQANVGSVAIVQFTNAGPAQLADSQLLRTGLEEGDVPIASLLRAFDAAGFDACYEFEGIPDLTGDARVAYVRRAREWFEALWA